MITRSQDSGRRLTRPLVVLAAVVALGGLSACGQTGLNASDAYKIGCPAVDAAVGGGSMVNAATVSGLEALRDSRTLGDEAQQWLTSAITLLRSASPNDLPADARKTIVDGCAETGYPLRNLRG